MNLRSPVGLWSVLNPSIYLVSVAPLLVVAIQAGISDAVLPALLLATGGVVALQHAVNLFNDLTDDRRGADVEKPVSWVRFHGGRTHVLLIHAALSVLAGVALGLSALWMADRMILLALGAPLAALGFLYNWGTRPLGYTMAAEVVTGLAYGPGVYGCMSLLAIPDPQVIPFLAGCIACSALSVSVLLAHQPPQVLTDALAGKHTFAVRHGVLATRWTSRILLVLAAVSFVLAAPVERSVLALAPGLLVMPWLTRKRNLLPGRILRGTCAALAVALIVEVLL